MHASRSVALAIVTLSGIASMSSLHAQPSQEAAPRILGDTCPKPSMPDAAARVNAQGTTVLMVHVDALGKATQVDIIKSSGRSREHKLLDRSAADSFIHCSFEPARDADGKPTDGTSPLNYTWKFE